MKENLIRFKYHVPEGHLCEFGSEEDKKRFQGFRHDVYEFCPLEQIFEDKVRQLAIHHNIISLETISRYDMAKAEKVFPAAEGQDGDDIL